MKSLKQIFEDKKEKYRLQDKANIRSDFKVAERNGVLYLTHQGVAFMKVAALSNAQDVAKALNDARDCAIEYEGL